MSDLRAERLAFYLDGDLDGAAAAELQRELDADPAFAREAAQVAVIDRLIRLHLVGAKQSEFAREAALRAGEVPAAGPFVQQVLQSVQRDDNAAQRQPGGGAGRRRLAWWRIVAISGLAAGFLLAVSWLGVTTWTDWSATRRTIASVESISGTVTIQRGSQTMQGKEGTPLQDGDTLAISTPGYLTLKYAADSHVPQGTAQATTRLSADGGAEFKLWTEQGAPRVEVLYGDLSADVAPRSHANALKLLSRFATAEVVGTRFRMRVDDWRTRLEVAEGKVQFQDTAGGAAKLVGAGERAAITNPAPLPELACHLKFDGDLRDSSLANVPMTWVGPPPAFAAGQSGKAAVFNGLNGRTNGNRVMAKPHPSLYAMRQITVALWAKRNDPAATSQLLVNHLRYRLLVWGDTAQFSLFLGKGEYQQSAGAYSPNVRVEALNNTEWHHLAMTYDSSTLRGYVDGQQVLSRPVNTGEIAEYTEYDLCVGGTPWDNSLDGMLDEVRIYRRALSADEVARLSRLQEP